jgi:hypothetical protein
VLLTVKCPHCANDVKIPPSASLATCGKCLTTFRADAAADEEAGAEADVSRATAPAAAQTSVPAADAQEDEPSWISPWGSAAFVVAALALMQGAVPVLGLWWLTVGLGVVGVLLVAQGIWTTRAACRTKDRVWFVLGGGLSAAALLVALVAPGLLNNRWAIDVAVPQSDPDAMVLVRRDQPLEEGKRLSAEDWADAVTEGIRQEEIFVRVESVKNGALPGKASGSGLLVHLRLANCKHERTITIEHFNADQHKPVLTDDAGRSYAFVEARPRKVAKGEAVFAPAKAPTIDLEPLGRQEYLLVFASPPSKFEALKLEVPASAWGRKGTCKLRISKLFEATLRKTL